MGSCRYKYIYQSEKEKTRTKFSLVKKRKHTKIVYQAEKGENGYQSLISNLRGKKIWQDLELLTLTGAVKYGLFVFYVITLSLYNDARTPMPLISVFIQLHSLVIHDLRKDAIFFQ